MSTEDRFRDLLGKVGYKAGRLQLQQLFSHEVAATDVIPWIVDNITEKNIVDPEMIREYNELQLTNPPFANSPQRSSLLSLSRLEDTQPSESDLLAEQTRLERHHTKQERQKVELRNLKEQLEQQLDDLEAKLQLSYREEDHFVDDLLTECEGQSSKACADLDSAFHSFSYILTDLVPLMATKSSSLLFTQSQHGDYWKQSEELTHELERLASDVVSSKSLGSHGQATRVDDLINRSQLERCPWFHELERLKQYKQVSKLRKVEQLVARTRVEAVSEFLSSHDPQLGLVNGSDEMEKIELIKECEKLRERKQNLLTKEIPSAVSDSLHCFGFPLLREYIPRICEEWNSVLLQKQQLNELAACHLDKARLFKIIADVELRQLKEMIQYLQKSKIHFQEMSELSQRRKDYYVQQSHSSTNFIYSQDTYLNSIASFLKFCVDKIEDHEGLRKIEMSTATPSVHKRQFSIAFSSKTQGHESTGLSPVSKMIKEQQSGIYWTPSVQDQNTEPVDLETSLRRLSVTPSPLPKRQSLFHSTPPEQPITRLPVGLHEVSFNANRLIALMKTSHQAAGKHLPESILKILISSREKLCSVYHRIFRTEGNQLVLSVPSLKSSFEGCDRLIEDLNKTSGELKTQFRSFCAFLERHPQEAKIREALLLFFIQPAITE